MTEDGLILKLSKNHDGDWVLSLDDEVWECAPTIEGAIEKWNQARAAEYGTAKAPENITLILPFDNE